MRVISLVFLPVVMGGGAPSSESWLGASPVPLIVPEWTQTTIAPMLSSLTFADLNSDGVKEVIATTYGKDPNPYSSGWVYVWDIQGANLPGWPIQTTSGPIPSTPAIGDIDGDGDQELVVGNWSQLFVWNHDGTAYPGWPRPYGGYNSVALEDLDEDGDREIVYPSGSLLYVFQHDGTPIPGFPVSVPHDDVGPPSVADIDGDSLLEVVAGITRGPVIQVPSRSTPGRQMVA